MNSKVIYFSNAGQSSQQLIAKAKATAHRRTSRFSEKYRFKSDLHNKSILESCKTKFQEILIKEKNY